MTTATPSRFGPVGAEAAFHLPLPGLLADFETVSAAVGMTDEFLEAPALDRIRLVQQWLKAFKDLKDAAVVEWFRDLSPARAGMPIVEQIEAFREECEEQQVTCPADLAILLQRY